MSEYYAAITAITVAIQLASLAFIQGNLGLQRGTRHSFVFVVGLLMVTTCCEFLGVLWDGVSPALHIPHVIVKYLELSVTPIMALFYGNAFFPIRRRKRAYACAAVSFLMQAVCLPFSLIFYVDAGNVYHHGPFYFLYNAAYLAGFLFFLVRVIRYAQQFQDQKSPELQVIVAFTLGGIICQAVANSLRVVWLTTSISFLMFYIHYIILLGQTDGLTGLLDRGCLDQKLASIKKRTVVIMLDIDHFKQLNDTYGHQQGDICLKNVANLLRRSFGGSGLCYRYGGDEFCVILENNTDKVLNLLAGFISNVTAFREEANPLLPYISFGYSIYTPGESIDSILDDADRMMYMTKHKKSNLA